MCKSCTVTNSLNLGIWYLLALKHLISYLSVYEMPKIEIAVGAVKEFSQYTHQMGMT